MTDEADASHRPLPIAIAKEAYEASRRHFAEGRIEAALGSIDDALRADPSFPNARNYRGWIRLCTSAGEPAKIRGAIDDFRLAHELFPDDATPVANMGDAWLRLGDPGAAINAMEALAVDGSPGKPAADNWLGWYFLQVDRDLPRSIAHLRLATSARRRRGLPWLNLGTALELSSAFGESYDAFGTALAGEGEFDRAFCHERRGAYESRNGWYRTALRSFRAALSVEEPKGGNRVATYREATRWLQERLSVAGAWWPREATDRRWLACKERPDPPSRTALLDALTRLATGDRYSRETAERKGEIDVAERFVLGQGSPPLGEHIDLETLSPAAHPGAPYQTLQLMRRWDAWLWAAWEAASADEPPRVLGANEWGEPLDGRLVEIDRAISEARFEDAADALAKLSHSEAWTLVDGIAIANRGAERARLAGDERSAARFLDLSVLAYQVYASGSSSGGEGLARSAEVKAAEEKAARWARGE